MESRDGGRPSLIYGRRCPADKIAHEVAVTRFALLFENARFIRGERVGRAVPDLTMIWDGRRCHVEIDHSENMIATQMNEKWDRYGSVSDAFILVVCRSEGRMQRVIQGAERVKDVALFTTFDRLCSGMVEPWIDRAGNAVGI